jgi:hypothetical protein
MSDWKRFSEMKSFYAQTESELAIHVKFSKRRMRFSAVGL